MPRFLFAVLLAIVANSALPAEDWPRFRGTNGMGTASGPAVAPNARNLLWKAALPGKGNGSPIVVGGKIYLQTASDDGKLRSLLCLNAADGKMLWSRDVPGKLAKLHQKNTLASGTPASDGEAIYCLWFDGSAMTLHAYDLSGTEKWSQSLGTYTSLNGPGHSPAVYNGKLFVNMDQDGKATACAFDAKTGAKLWAASRPGHKASYTTPFLLEQSGRSAQLIVASTTAVDAYDPDSGRVQWHYSITLPPGGSGMRMIGNPVIANGLLVAYSGEGSGTSYAIAIKSSANGDVSHSAKVWHKNRQYPFVPSMLARGNYLYWIHDKGFAYCSEAKTGEIVWQEKVFAQSDVMSSPILMGDEIVAIAESGKSIVLKAAPKFEEVAGGNVGEKVVASPAAVNGKLFVRGEGHLFCYGNSSSAKR